MDRRMSVLMALDEPYAQPVRVTVTSLLSHLRPGVAVDLYLMATDLKPATRSKIEAFWDRRVRVHWTPVDSEKLGRLHRRSDGSSPAASARLLAGSSLPGDLARVIYLDADLLIQGDLYDLWERDMDGEIVLAVQDSYIQRSPGGAYFNSGVMVMDLEAWRAADIEQRCFDAASRLPTGTRWLDQQILNVCLAGRWGVLSPVWNKQSALDLFPDWQCSPYSEEEFRRARSAPAIIHFCSQTKPWHHWCDHRAEDVAAYREILGAVAPEPSVVARIMEALAAPHRRLLFACGAAFRARRRAHALRAMLPTMLRTALSHPWTLVSIPVTIAAGQAAVLRASLSVRRDAA